MTRVYRQFIHDCELDRLVWKLLDAIFFGAVTFGCLALATCLTEALR